MVFVNGETLNIKRFSSGEMKLLHSSLMQNIKNGTADILFMNSSISIFELLIIIRYYTSQNVKVNLTLAYLPYQRMDHNNGYEVETLKLVAEILNNMNLNSLTICEPHCDLNYFKNAKKISYVDLLAEKVFSEIGFDTTKDVLFFTDKGSLKRYEHLGTNYVRCEKMRDKETGLISSYKVIGTIKPEQKIVIVDDIISTGDTMMSALDELKKLTDQKIYIIAGHYERNKYNKRLLNSEQVEKIFSTNSLSKRQFKKLKLYDVKELIYNKK